MPDRPYPFAGVVPLVAAAVSAIGVGLVGMAVRSRRASTEQRQLIRWLAAAPVIIVAGSSILLVLHRLLGGAGRAGSLGAEPSASNNVA